MLRGIPGVVFGAIVVACNTTPPAPPTFGGTVRGQTFVPLEAVSGQVFTSTGLHVLDFNTTGLILLRNTAGICEDFDARVDRNSAQYFAITVQALDSDGVLVPARAAGIYPVALSSAANQYARASFWTVGSRCESVVTANAIDGTVTLTSVSDDYAYTGTFDVTFDSGDEVTGTFDAAPCSTLSIEVGPTCS
jgi:hypothetical protein